ncbi:hypothetical protein F4821DRAFT_279937 [Hypoxylon rubiginosum]|uniref:Uncharacterized protein n=1 Tax=Hypoxylon rubiginosum TaxID=110542 RepID=A0ACC0CX40_9PEZI|nr:hypothetical protein F4821DRAFT_279937 [Hypoxylon rubiginosum]
MANDDTPEMPAAASSNMAMSMSTVSTTSKKLSSLTIDSATPTQDAPKESDVQSQSGHSKDIPVTTSAANARRDKPSNRERALNIQRIELAEKLGNERKQRTDLEARIASLQEEIASLTLTNTSLAADRVRLHAELDSAVRQLESVAAKEAQTDQATRKRISDLETKLDEMTKSFEQASLNHGIVQKDYDKIVEMCGQQTDRANQLDKEVEHRTNQMQQLRETNQEELKAVDDEIMNLEDKLKVAEEKLHAQTENTKAESRELQESLDKLQRSIMPFAQTIVICVDVSGSAGSVIDDIKQAYRDTLHKINLYNCDAKVAVVLHGSRSKPDPSPLEPITDSKFHIMDSVSEGGGTEDYTYCLKQGMTIFNRNLRSKRLLLLIGDGDAMCSNRTLLFEICRQLKSAKILAHSIALPNNSPFASLDDTTMKDISEATGGRVEYKYTYMSFLDEILRHERAQHFGS